ncbi:MAG: FkbM family methyltransferase [Candidatus Peregrinibacteria bacterium]|nr:FkbM family methyltransferase [Candidatus Peregrinibacteria bacterium]
MNKHVKIFGKDIEVLVESDADNSVFEEIFVDRDYGICDDVIKKAGVSGGNGAILDIGAHKGYFSIYASVLNGGRGEQAGKAGVVKIFAYEPEEKNFAVLKENLKMNRVKNVFAKNVAVNGNDGMCELFLSEDSHNHSVIGEGVSRKVNSVSFQTIVEKHLVREECENIDLVKMDCEGAEFEILESLDSYVNAVEIFKKIKSFCVEYHEFLPEMRAEKLVNILKKYGYKVDAKKSHYDNRMGMIWARK